MRGSVDEPFASQGGPAGACVSRRPRWRRLGALTFTTKRLYSVTARELLRILRSLGGVEVRQKGSHVRVQCGESFTTVPVHAGEDLGPGLLRAIERDLEPSLGKGWLKKGK